MSIKVENKWVCNLCYPDAIEIGEIAEDYWLVLDNAKYSILGGLYGHKDKYPFTFLDKPTPDPDPNQEHEEEDDPILAEANRWLDRANDSYKQWVVPVEVGYCFMHACITTGNWDQNQYKIFEQWLYDKAGRLVKEWENVK